MCCSYKKPDDGIHPVIDNSPDSGRNDAYGFGTDAVVHN